MKRLALLASALLTACANHPALERLAAECTELPGVEYRYVGKSGVRAYCHKPYPVRACARHNPDDTWTVFMPRPVTGPGDPLCDLLAHENLHTYGRAHDHVPPRRLGPGGGER